MPTSVDASDEDISFIAPIVRGRFSSIETGRAFDLGDRSVNGWYAVHVDSGTVEIAQADMIDLYEYKASLPRFTGFTCGDWVVPRSFDLVKRKWGLLGSSRMLMNDASSWNVVECIVWGRERAVMFDRIIMGPESSALMVLRDRLNDGQGIVDYRDASPELRYLYVLHSLAKKNQGHAIEISGIDDAEERIAVIRSYGNGIEGRLEQSIEEAGGCLVSFEESGERLDIGWTAGDERLSSSISKDFSARELGYCSPDDDRRHGMKSATLLARDYESDGLIYKRRDTKSTTPA